MRRRRSSGSWISKLLPGALLACAVLGPGGSERARAQTAPDAQPGPTSQPTSQSQPSSAPAEPINPLPSPARMMQFFTTAVSAGRTQDALACLDFANVDEEVRRERGADYVRQLAEILARLGEEGLFDPALLTDDPTAKPQTIGRDPLLLVLERQENRRWQFSATTVAEVPEWHARLEEELAKLRAPTSAPVEPIPQTEQAPVLDRLRSPYHVVEYFLVKSADAKKDPANYADAMTCLDFSEVQADELDQVGPTYVDQLAAILAQMRADATFQREELPREPDSEVAAVTRGEDPLLITIVRQTDGRWRFAAKTVERIPAMVAALEARAAVKAEQGAPGAAAPAVNAGLQLDTSSPRATLNLFLTAMADNEIEAAVRCLDLSRVSEADRSLAGILAGKLYLVLNRYKVIVVQEVPNDPSALQPYMILNHTAGRIEIARHRGGERDGEWLFSPATVASIERLYEAFEDKPVLPEFRDQRISFFELPSLYVREYVVPQAWKKPLWGLKAWQWWGLLLVLAAGIAARQISSFVLPRLSRRVLRTETSMMLPAVAHKALLPTSNFIMVLTWWGGLQVLDLGAVIMSWAWMILKIVLATVGVQAFYRLIDLFMGYLTARVSVQNVHLRDVLLPLLQKALKVVVVALGFLLIATAVGIQIGPLLAGLGLGGLAFALAAQDTIKNFFGSITVVLDRPFYVGDWIKIGSVEGTVESVGLRSSRVRTFYNSEVIIPNSELINATVDNMGRRRYRRIRCMIAVTYSTGPEALEAFCEGIRELIRKHPYTRKDYYQVWVNEFADSSINILLYCFHRVPDWTNELRERHRLFLDIIRLAKTLGVDFAFPTQTVYLARERGDASRQNGDSDEDTGGVVAKRLPERDPLARGRSEAAQIVHAQLGDSGEVPPPYQFPEVE